MAIEMESYRGISMLKIIVFTAVALWLLGVAAQGVSVYLLALLSGLMCGKSQKSGVLLWVCISALMACHLIFLVPNAIGNWNSNFSDFHPTIQNLFTSRLSSATFLSPCVAALGWCMSRFFNFKFPSVSSESLFETITKSLLYSVLLFVACIAYQKMTGFDFRSIGKILPPSEKLANGTYRVVGFFGHPLSVASVCLGLFGFSSMLAWQSFSLRKKSKAILLSSVSLAHLFAVFASGGRTAAVVGSLFLLCLSAYVLWGMKGKLRMVSFLVIPAMVVGLFLISGQWVRVTEAFQNSSGLLGADRIKFWKVHAQIFYDHVFFGVGPAWLDAGLRSEYYANLGFGSLKDKFNAHNVYLETLACVGLLGTSVLTVLVGVVEIFLRKSIRNLSYAKYWFVAVLSALSLNLIHGFTQNTLFDSNFWLVFLGMFWILLMFVSLEAEPELVRQ